MLTKSEKEASWGKSLRTPIKSDIPNRKEVFTAPQSMESALSCCLTVTEATTEIVQNFSFLQINFVGKASENACHRKILTLFDTLSFQIFPQKLIDDASSEPKASSLFSSSHSS